MYSTCIHCNAALGTNEAIEHFPVGQRLAYDADKGRLWVVCRRCARWNLSPLEERWEAIEEAERLFRDTRLRMSTENIGLARLRDGTDLVRIGQPQRPEMAAWRYGEKFARRRQRIITGTAGALAAAGAVGLLVPLTGFVTALLIGGVATTMISAVLASMGAGSVVFTTRLLPDGQGAYLAVGQNELPSVRLVGDAHRWGLRIPFKSRRATTASHWSDLINTGALHETTLYGDVGLEAARKLLPLVNGAGARPRTVSDAVEIITTHGDAEGAFSYAASQVHVWAAKTNFGDTGALSFLPPAVRLALEMSAHEDQERRAMAGELAQLEQAWKDAEEIAAIADDLLVSGSVSQSFERLRKRVRG